MHNKGVRWLDPNAHITSMYQSSSESIQFAVMIKKPKTAKWLCPGTKTRGTVAPKYRVSMIIMFQWMRVGGLEQNRSLAYHTRSNKRMKRE